MEAADQLGVDVKSISHWESSRIIPSSKYFARIHAFLKIIE
ncbi:helix-turn-helix transcriptional regulator [Paenibacillus sp. ISL-20]